MNSANQTFHKDLDTVVGEEIWARTSKRVTDKNTGLHHLKRVQFQSPGREKGFQRGTGQIDQAQTCGCCGKLHSKFSTLPLIRCATSEKRNVLFRECAIEQRFKMVQLLAQVQLVSKYQSSLGTHFKMSENAFSL